MNLHCIYIYYPLYLVSSIITPQTTCLQFKRAIHHSPYAIRYRALTPPIFAIYPSLSKPPNKQPAICLNICKVITTPPSHGASGIAGTRDHLDLEFPLIFSLVLGTTSHRIPQTASHPRGQSLHIITYPEPPGIQAHAKITGLRSN